MVGRVEGSIEGLVACRENLTTHVGYGTGLVHPLAPQGLRAVQGRVAGPSVQLRSISLISRSSADQQSVS